MTLRRVVVRKNYNIKERRRRLKEMKIRIIVEDVVDIDSIEFVIRVLGFFKEAFKYKFLL